ncbi:MULTISPECIES: META domain-containing protein [unclassified Photobacterium]|uniref:META domain-containing protein n=1 Tax=unclassified Photobacterium TaxID=2628852 RepID=UPI000D160967|nr:MULTISPECIES: META domain-containing protein [unclassified Photobacterium]PSV28282.1 heat-shock protein HslJ [Photobacterium sp. GB-56]PSV32546.1 heat-shock protein HslJ [Photobacterium sp. GB-72]PSV38753.1 heat-shock protein HslJ [Photobacterium sp. GB-27]PSV40069.1 heat-shock protein HslJ [Photobacterium sp. GB-210]PSV47208.1 heat-shock protein HslJ [Photobacterium sp. GB-36]
MKKRLLSVLVLPLMLTACAGNSAMNSAPHKVTANEISNGNWELVQIDHKALALQAPFQAPSLELSSDLAANGNAGCNRYFGQAELKDGQLRIEKMGMTMMLCPDDAMKVEQTFSKSLSDWNKVAISGDTLTLTNAKHTLTFTKKVADTK